MTATETKTYAIAGMSCGHCATAVSDEVERIPGVNGVEVQLEGGLLSVSGDSVSGDAVRGAVEEAGYELASR